MSLSTKYIIGAKWGRVRYSVGEGKGRGGDGWPEEEEKVEEEEEELS